MQATQPAPYALAAGDALNVTRSKAQLLAENALLRQQLIILRRHVKRPKLTNTDRFWLVVLASRVNAWRQALLLVRPDTLLGWHRHLGSVRRVV